MSIHGILVHEKWHPFKIKMTHKLTEDDPDQRIEFCDKMHRYNDDNTLITFFDYIIFSDETSFQLNRAINRHNCQYLLTSDENPHWTSDLRIQYPYKLNVLTGFCEVRGLFFIDGNLNVAIYLDLLRNELYPPLKYV